MSSGSEEGGTRIQKRQQVQPQFNQAPPQMQQVPEQMYQQEDPQMYQQEVPQMYQQQVPRQQGPPVVKFKSQPGITNVDFNSISFKYSLLVACIFVLLNSKIIWTQIIKFPFMGNMEPSIMALLVNSMLAGIIFYIISNQF